MYYSFYWHILSVDSRNSRLHGQDTLQSGSSQVVYQYPPSLSLPLCLSGLKQRSWNKHVVGIISPPPLFPNHSQMSLSEPMYMFRKQREREYNFKKKIRNDAERKASLVWLRALWLPLLDVCKRAEKPVLTPEQGCAFWCIGLCRLREGEPIFHCGRVTGIYQPGLSFHNYSNL